MSRLNEYNAAVDALKQLPFGNHSHMYFSPHREGYREGYRDYTFGMRAGPSREVENLAHELAHAAEFGAASFTRRCFMGGFVFKSTKMRSAWINGRNHTWHDDCQTMESTFRELRTFAIQKHILEMMGVAVTSSTIQMWARVMDFMPDYYHVPGAGDDRKRHEYCEEMIELLYHDVVPDGIILEITGWLDGVARRNPPKALQQLTIFTGYDDTTY